MSFSEVIGQPAIPRALAHGLSVEQHNDHAHVTAAGSRVNMHVDALGVEGAVKQRNHAHAASGCDGGCYESAVEEQRHIPVAQQQFNLFQKRLCEEQITFRKM
jgi:hypothetical protein